MNDWDEFALEIKGIFKIKRWGNQHMKRISLPKMQYDIYIYSTNGDSIRCIINDALNIEIDDSNHIGVSSSVLSAYTDYDKDTEMYVDDDSISIENSHSEIDILRSVSKK